MENILVTPKDRTNMERILFYKKTVWITVFTVLLCVLGYGQIGAPASVPFQEVPGSSFRLRGELKMIGNAIVAPSELNDGTPVNPNDPNNNTLENGQFNAYGYIDIDNDPNTFSSSSARFERATNCGAIRYAGLYWSATYIDMDNVVQSGNRGLVANYANPTFPDPREPFNTIKFKPPGVADYITIPPSEVRIIYDGYPDDPSTPVNENPFNPNPIPDNRNNNAVVDMPYHCYADVTQYIENLANPDGLYFVADQRAAVGQIETDPDGGANISDFAGGWTLVIIYEDTNLSNKFISTNNGLGAVSGSTGPVDITYTGFTTLPPPLPVRARFGLGVYEGDRNISGDRFFLQPTNGTPAAPVEITTQPNGAFPNSFGNFFDSSISVDGVVVDDINDRNPNSTNTLAYDVDIFDIQNDPAGTDPALRNQRIANDQTEVNFRLVSTGDKYQVFVQTFQVEIIEPELLMTKRVFDDMGNDITDGDVNFADTLFYRVTLENIGNEDILNTTITDELPINVDFDDVIFDPGLNATYDPATRIVTVSVDDDVLEEDDPAVGFTIEVTVVADCSSLRDACSDEVVNTAISRYTGEISGETRDGISTIFRSDECRTDIAVSTNFLIREDICFTEANPATLCRGQVPLSAGNGFDTYEWTRDGVPPVLSTDQIYIATSPGTYVVRSTSVDCRDSQRTFVVSDGVAIENNIVDLIPTLDMNPNANGNIRVCPDTGEDLPEIFLCGNATTLDLDSGYDDGAANIVWQRLDPTACSTVVRDINCPTEEIDCEPFWTTVGTGRILTVGSSVGLQAGEYRISIDVSGDCAEFVYFNLFQSNFEPTLRVVRDIICGSPGSIEVTNVSNQYEYQLVSPDGSLSAYGNTTLFTGLTQVGSYRINARQLNAPAGACEFPSPSVPLRAITPTIDIINVVDPGCEGDTTGEFTIQVNGGLPDYRYVVTGPNGYNRTVTGSASPTLDLTGLEAGTYTWNAYSDDDDSSSNCFDQGTIDLEEGEVFEVRVEPTAQIVCNPGYQPDPTLNDENSDNYDPTAPPFDPDEFIALVGVEILSTPASGNYTFSTVPDFSTQINDVTLTGGIYNVRFTTAGTFTIYVLDNSSGCDTQGVTRIIDRIPLQATAATNNPACPNDQGSITVTVTAGESPFDFLLDGVLSPAGTDVVITTFPGTFTFNNIDATTTPVVSVIDGNGCEEIIPYTPFDIPDAITAETLRLRKLNCRPATPGALYRFFNIQGGSGSYEWSFNATTGFTAIAGNTVEIDFPNQGTFTVYLRDSVAGDCEVAFPITVEPRLEIDSIIVDNEDNNNCEAQTFTADVYADPPLSADDEANGFTYDFTIVPAPAAGPATFSIATAAGRQNITFNRNVTYTITAERSDNACTAPPLTFFRDLIDEISITSANQTSPVTCIGGNDGEFQFTVDITTFPSFVYEIYDRDPALAGAVLLAGPITQTTSPVNIDNTILTAGIEEGTYWIQVTDPSSSADPANACSAVRSVDIIEPNDPITFAPEVNQTCTNNVVSVSGVSGGNGPIYTYELFNSANVSQGASRPINQTYDNIPNGAGYYIVVTDTDGCPSARETFDINMLPAITLTVPNRELCLDDGIASFEVSIAGGTADFAYSITRNGVQIVSSTNLGAGVTSFTTPDFTQPGTYIVTVTDSVGCFESIIQEIAPQLTINASLLKDLTCEAGNEAAQIQVNVTGGNGTTSLLININGSGFNPYTGTIPFTTTTAGTYQFRVEDSETPACSADSAVITVTPAPDPNVLAPTRINPTCNGDTNGSVRINIDTTIGTGPYEIDFNGLGFSSQTTYGGLGEGTYNYTVRDSKECTQTFSVTLAAPPVVIGIQDTTNITCGAMGNEPGAIELQNITGGVPPYNLSLLNASDLSLATTTSTNPVPGAPSGSNITFNGLGFGDYVFRVVDMNSCVFDFTYTISTTPIFTITPTITNPGVCATGVTAQIDVSGGVGPFEIREFTPGGTEPYVPLNAGPTTHIFNNLPFDTPFTFEVIDRATNCTDIQTLTPPPSPSTINIAIQENPVRCVGDDDGSLDYTITGYQGTELTYSIFRSNDLTTPITAAYTFTPPATNPQTVPAAGTATGNIADFGPGTYLLRVEETDGAVADPCNAAIEFTITESATPFVYVDTDIIDGNCEASSQGVVTVRGGTPPYGFLVVEDGLANPGTYDPSNVVVLDQTITADWDLYITDANDCVLGPIDLTASVIDDPQFTIVPAFVVDPCSYDNNYTLTVRALGVGQLQFGIDDGDTSTGDTSVFADGTLITAGTPDLYEFTYTITSASIDNHTLTVRDANGCTDTSTITVYDPLDIEARFTVAPDCNNASGEIRATITGTPAGAISYELQDASGTATGNTSGDTTGIYTGVAPGSYIVEVTDAGRGPAPGCPFTAPVSITAPIEPTLDAAPNSSISCNGEIDGTITAIVNSATNDPNAAYQYRISAPPAAVTPLQDSPVFSGLGPGTYTVEVVATLTNGVPPNDLDVVCINTGNYTIDDVTVPIATVTQGSEFDCDMSDGTENATIEITLVSGGNGADYTATVTQPDGVIRTDVPVVAPTTVIDAPLSGIYNIQIFDSGNCPSIVYNVDIAPLTPLSDPAIVVTQDISCPTDEIIEITVSGGSGNYIFERIETDASGVEVVAQTGVPTTPANPNANEFTLPRDIGTYVFRVRDLGDANGLGLGCEVRATHEIEPFDLIETTAIQLTPEICFGDMNGQAEITIAGYIGDFSYEIYDTSTTPETVVFTSTVNLSTDADAATADVYAVPPAPTGLSLGNYRIAITQVDAPLCTDEAFFSIDGPANEFILAPIADVSSDCDPINNGAIQATASGSRGVIRYDIVDDAAPGTVLESNTTGNFGGLAPGNYTVTAYDEGIEGGVSYSCPDSESFTVNPPQDDVVVTAIATPVTCNDGTDGTITITATATDIPLRYSLTPQPGGTESETQASNVFDNLVAGDYIVRAYDTSNCTAETGILTVGEPEEMMVQPSNPTPADCIVRTSSITVTATPATRGPYTYQGFDVTQLNEVGVPDNQREISLGPASTTNAFTGLGTGLYRFQVFDANGCPSDKSIIVAVDIPELLDVAVNVITPDLVCFGDTTGSVDAVASGGLGDNMYSVDVNPIDPGLPTETRGPQGTTFFDNLPAGTHVYRVESMMPGSGCVIERPFTINQPAEPFEAEAEATDITCSGADNGTITVTASGGNIGTPQNPYNYSLFNQDTGEQIFGFVGDLVDNQVGVHVFEELPEGRYIVVAEDAKGCPVRIEDLEIEEPGPIIVSEISSTPERCAGDTNGSVTISISGGTADPDTGNPVYYWSIDDINFELVSDPNNLLIENLPGGRTVVYVRDFFNDPNCQGLREVNIEPGVDINGALVDSSECPEIDPITGLITTPVMYFVDFDATGDNINDSNVRFVLEAVDIANPDPIQIDPVNNPRRYEVLPNVTYQGRIEYLDNRFPPENVQCSRDLGTIILPPYNALDNLRAEMTGNPEDPNEYEILVEGGADGDPSNYTYEVVRLEGVNIFESTDEEVRAAIEALTDLDYEILEENIFFIRRTGYYALRVTDNKGCQIIRAVALTYINIRIPNYFTPGEDRPETPDDDSFWYPRQITPDQDPNNPSEFFFEQMEVRVFDRYGRLLAEFKGNDRGWDGIYKGKELPSGDYWYTVILNDAENKEFTGHFTLYR